MKAEVVVWSIGCMRQLSAAIQKRCACAVRRIGAFRCTCFAALKHSLQIYCRRKYCWYGDAKDHQPAQVMAARRHSHDHPHGSNARSGASVPSRWIYEQLQSCSCELCTICVHSYCTVSIRRLTYRTYPPYGTVLYLKTRVWCVILLLKKVRASRSVR